MIFKTGVCGAGSSLK